MEKKRRLLVANVVTSAGSPCERFPSYVTTLTDMNSLAVLATPSKHSP